MKLLLHAHYSKTTVEQQITRVNKMAIFISAQKTKG